MFNNGSGGSFRLDGRVALVTGSTRGLGKQMALGLARAGARTAMNYVNDREVAEAAFADLQRISADSCLVQADVTDPISVARMCREVAERLGPIDVLVVNATCSQPELPFEEYDWDFFQTMLDFFVKSPVLLMKSCLPHMKAQGWGRIISTASAHSKVASPFKSAYNAAKHGLDGLPKTVALELAPHGVTANCISPGYVWTSLIENQIPDTMQARGLTREQVIDDVLLVKQATKKFVQPAEIAAVAVFLCRDEAQNVTGANWSGDGGWTAE